MPMSTNLRQIAEEYINFEVLGKRFSVPYAISHNPTPAYAGEGRTSAHANYGGKGTPAEIRQTLIRVAKQSKFSLDTSSADQIRDFMVKHGIGVDCSGFVYNVLDEYLRASGQPGLAGRIRRFPGLKGRADSLLFRSRAVRRASASTLTSDLNTTHIEKAAEIKPGDMLRLTHASWAGNHIAIVVEVTPKLITYAHSSVYTPVTGTHFGQIKIVDKSLGLEKQRWLEQTSDGKNYGQDAFVPARGDAVRRLKSL